ncbi:MAG: type II secretion system secretin GspD [Usitatibacter sp.]
MSAHTPKKLPIAAVLLAASCAMLPKGMQPAKDTPAEVAATPAATAPAPAASKGVPFGPAAPQPGSEARVYSGTGTFVNTAPMKTPAPPGPQEASLNFESLDVREVAKVILGDYLHASYTVHPAVTGTVTFRTIRPIAIADLLPTLEMLLRQNNAAVVLEGDIYKVLPITAVRGSISPQLGGVNRPLPPGFSVIVVPLKYVGVKEMVKLLQPFSADNTIIPDETRNLVIVAGGQRELQHVIDAIELFDVDWLAGYSVGLFPVKSADVKSLTGDLDKIFGATGQSPLAGIVRVIPIERMNGLLVVTTQPKYLEMAKTWIDRIDQVGGTGGGSRLFVYNVRNGKAENLAQIVGDLFSSRRPTTGGPALAPGQRPAEIRSVPYSQLQQPNSPTGPGAGSMANPAAAGAATLLLPGGVGTTASEVRIIADKDTNSLLILATPGDYEVVENALRRLDVVRRQVMVEVFLAEVELTDDLSLGIEWFLKTRNGTTGQLNLGGLPSGGPVITPTNTVPIAPPVFQLVAFSADQVRAVLNTLGSDNRAKTLASPNIMVLDNEKAEIKVGKRISVQTQTQTGVSTGTGVLNSFQYLETGVILDVTPRVNSGGMVTLDIEQEVSAPTSTPTVANPNPDIATRNAKTSIAVANGESVALAGLIQETFTTGSSGVPLISKIPVLGALFGSQNMHRDRTELVLIVTPRIINNSQQAREVTEELRTKMPTLEGLLPKRPTTPAPDSGPGTSSMITPPAPPAEPSRPVEVPKK